MKPRIFISHSSFDDPYTRELSTRLGAELAERSEIWLDKARLQGGDRWRDEIYRELLGCHAAVLLLSPAALDSPWVLKEATILSFRGALRERFKLIQVLLEGVTLDQVRAAFPALYLDEVQALTAQPDDLGATVAKIAAAFADLPRGVSDDMGQWTVRVREMLRRASDPILEQALTHLTRVDEDGFDRAELMAHVLLHENSHGLFVALRHLIGQGPDLRQLVRQVTPAIIAEQTAAPVRAAMRTPSAGVVALGARSDRVGSVFAVRAACWSMAVKVIKVGVVPTEDTAATAAGDVDEAIKLELGVVPSPEWLRETGLLLVIVLSVDTTLAGTMRTVVGRVRNDWPSAVVVALTGRLEDDGGEPIAPFTVTLPETYEERLLEHMALLTRLPDESTDW